MVLLGPCPTLYSCQISRPECFHIQAYLILVEKKVSVVFIDQVSNAYVSYLLQ
jgi:hypothetical protein